VTAIDLVLAAATGLRILGGLVANARFRAI
jgi:hypothetical protein